MEGEREEGGKRERRIGEEKQRKEEGVKSKG